MSERIPQSTAIRIPLFAVQSADHLSPATGKTIVITISKNGGSFANPSAGATNATEIANGWYYVDLSTTDTGTLGPLIVHGSGTGADNVDIAYDVVNANTGGWGNLDAAVSSRMATYTQPTGFLTATFPATVASTTNITTVGAVSGSVGSVTGNVGGNVAGSVGSVTGNVGGNVTGSVGSVVGDVGGNVVGSVASVTGNVGGNVVGSVASVTGNVGGNVTGSVGSLAAQAKADVNTEVVDALSTDTYAEPGQGIPAATASLAAKIGYLYKSWRNRTTQTADTYSLYADDGTTVDQKATVSDDGTTFDRGEVASGP